MRFLPPLVTLELVEVAYELAIFRDFDRYLWRQRNFAMTLKAIRVWFFRETAGFDSHNPSVLESSRDQQSAAPTTVTEVPN